MPGSTAGPDPAAQQAVAVSNAGPLIALGRLDLLRLLTALFTVVHVPEQVAAECLARPDNEDAQRIRTLLENGRLSRCTVQPVRLPGLDAGESAAIGHARALGCTVLLDDAAARKRAAALGLQVADTLGLLVRSRRLGLIGPLAPLVAALRASGQRLSHDAVTQALAAVGEEAPPR